MKDAASKDKMEWIYINRILLCIVTFIVSIIVIMYLHNIVIQNVYTDPTANYDVIGQMSEPDTQSAMEITESDNDYIIHFRGDTSVTEDDIAREMERGRINDDYENSSADEIQVAAKRVLEKLQTVNSENMQWFEVLLAMVFAIIAYNAPIWMLKFQARMRQLEMEDEVMQFQTIILMLMRIERVNVEIILEWLERYANIFKEQ